MRLQSNPRPPRGSPAFQYFHIIAKQFSLYCVCKLVFPEAGREDLVRGFAESLLQLGGERGCAWRGVAWRPGPADGPVPRSNSLRSLEIELRPPARPPIALWPRGLRLSAWPAWPACWSGWSGWSGTLGATHRATGNAARAQLYNTHVARCARLVSTNVNKKSFMEVGPYLRRSLHAGGPSAACTACSVIRRSRTQANQGSPTAGRSVG